MDLHAAFCEDLRAAMDHMLDPDHRVAFALADGCISEQGRLRSEAHR